MRKQRTGKTGELAASLWFARHGWQMDKIEPESKFVKGMGFIRGLSKGYFDFIGHTQEAVQGSKPFSFYRACEVKERPGDTYPCSMLSRKQTAWAKGKPVGTCFVVVWESDYGELEVFPWQEKGSYKRGEGIK